MSSIRARLRSKLRELLVSESGSSESIEIVLWAPIWLMAAAALFQGVTYYHANNMAHAIAQSAYEQQRLWGADPAAGLTFASEQLAAAEGTLNGATVSVQEDATTITVTITGNSPTLLPILELPPVTATYSGPAEIWTGQ